MQEMETHVCSLGQKVPLEQEMATQSHILAWKNARAEEPGGLQSMGLHRVWQDRVNEHTSSGNILYGMLLNWDLSHVFLVVKLELQVLGKKIIQKLPFSSHLIKGICCQRDSSDFSTVKLLFSPSFHITLLENHNAWYTLKEWRVMIHLTESGVPHELFGILLLGRLVYSFFFTYWLIYFLHIDSQLFLHHQLESLSFNHWIFFAFL